MLANAAAARASSRAGFTTVYDFSNDRIDLLFPLIGLGLALVGAAVGYLLGKPATYCLPPVGIGIFIILISGVVPWLSNLSLARAVARGEAEQVEGPIRDWRLMVGKRIRKDRQRRSHHEYFSVGNVKFHISWNALEAGFANRGSKDGSPSVRLQNGMTARIRYVPSGDPDKSPRIVRIELAGLGALRATQFATRPNPDATREARIFDEAEIIAAEPKAQIYARLYDFERRTGHQFVVVTRTSLNGQPIAKFATDLANRMAVGSRGLDDGILILVVPDQHEARIVVGRGLEAVLTDAACKDILKETIAPLFRRGDFSNGIDVGAAAIIGTVCAEELKAAQRDAAASG